MASVICCYLMVRGGCLQAVEWKSLLTSLVSCVTTCVHLPVVHHLRALLRTNSTCAISCGFVVQQAVQQNPQRIRKECFLFQTLLTSLCKQCWKRLFLLLVTISIVWYVFFFAFNNLFFIWWGEGTRKWRFGSSLVSCHVFYLLSLYFVKVINWQINWLIDWLIEFHSLYHAAKFG